MLYHRMFDNGTNTKAPTAEGIWSGGHSFSIDGLNWSPISRCYNTTVYDCLLYTSDAADE